MAANILRNSAPNALIPVPAYLTAPALPPVAPVKTTPTTYQPFNS